MQSWCLHFAGSFLKSLSSSSVYSRFLHLTESGHIISQFFSFHMAHINKETSNAETGLELHVNWLAGLYTHTDWPSCCCWTNDLYCPPSLLHLTLGFKNPVETYCHWDFYDAFKYDWIGPIGPRTIRGRKKWKKNKYTNLVIHLSKNMAQTLTSEMMERRNNAVFKVSSQQTCFHTFLCNTLPMWASFSESVIQEVYSSVSQRTVRKNTCWQLGGTNAGHICVAWYAFIWPWL